MYSTFLTKGWMLIIVRVDSFPPGVIAHYLGDQDRRLNKESPCF